jgi:putative membrane protein
MKTAFLGLSLALCAATAACMPAPPVASVAAATSVTTATAFVSMASVSDQFEIQTSQLALERARDPQVRRFATRMIRDHQTSSQRLMSIASRSSQGAMPAPGLDARHAAMLQTLSSTPEGSFDAAYVQMQANAHQEAITMFQTYSSQGDDPALRTFARRTLPTLQMHAEMVGSLGGAGGTAGM